MSLDNEIYQNTTYVRIVYQGCIYGYSFIWLYFKPYIRISEPPVPDKSLHDIAASSIFYRKRITQSAHSSRELWRVVQYADRDIESRLWGNVSKVLFLWEVSRTCEHHDLDYKNMCVHIRWQCYRGRLISEISISSLMWSLLIVILKKYHFRAKL